MARRRFFVEEVHNGQAELLGEEAHHLTHVLRVEQGQRYEISNNAEVFLAEVEVARKNRVVFRILEKLQADAPTMRVCLYLSLIKFDHLELALEKATELGVTEIVLVDANRSEKGIERGAEKRMTRWRRILLEASQQSRRAQLPQISGPVRFSDAAAAEASHRLFLDEARTGMPILKALPKLGAEDSVALLVGPEGGWTDAERVLATESGWKAVSLSTQVLRAETAAIAALAVIGAVALAHFNDRK